MKGIVLGKRGWVFGLPPALVSTRHRSAEFPRSAERAAYGLEARANVDIAI